LLKYNKTHEYINSLKSMKYDINRAVVVWAGWSEETFWCCEWMSSWRIYV